MNSNIITAAQAADILARYNELEAWRNGRLSYHPSEVPAHIRPPTNEEISALEVYNFLTMPPSESYAAYLGKDPKNPGRYVITTFTGDRLATVTRYVSRSAPFNSWLSDVRGSFWALGIDGRSYHGRHNGPGIYCRMRPAKHQARRQ
jgi:hypothetical protein